MAFPATFAALSPILEMAMAGVGSVVAAALAPAAPVLCGVALSVLAFRNYAYQREVLKGQNRNTAIPVGYTHILMCSIVFTTILILPASPFIAPVLPFIPIIWGVSVAASVLAAMCAGGYQKLQKDWGQSGIKPLQWIIKAIDFALRFTPRPIKYVLGNLFSRLHPWIGTLFFTAQVALFIGIAAVVSPALGITGLAYFGLSYLRAKNYLPSIVSKAFEKLNFWMGMLAGFFVPNAFMYAYTVYNMASTFALHVVFPKMSRLFLGKESEFLEMTDKSSKKEKVEPALPKDIDLANFKQLLKQFPRTATRANAHNDGLDEDLKRLREEYKHYCEQHKTLVARKARYDAFKQLKTSPRLFNRVKYYLGVVPMNMRRHLTSLRTYPYLPNAFLNHKSNSNSFGIKLGHVKHVPTLATETPHIDFKAFLVDVTKSIETDPNFVILLKKSFEQSPKFLQGELKEKIEELEYNKRNLTRCLESVNKLDEQQFAAKVQQVKAKISSQSDRTFLNLVKGFEQVTIASESRKASRFTRLVNWASAFFGTKRTPHAKVAPTQDLPAAAGSEQTTVRSEFIDNLSTQLEDCKKTIEEKKLTMAKEWGDQLHISADATEDEVYLAYFKMQLADICKQMETGGVGWDKSYHSVAAWQKESKHVLNYIQSLLRSRDPEKIAEGHVRLRLIVVEAGERCAKMVFEAVHNMYKQDLEPFYVAEANLSAPDLIGINMQFYRNSTLDKLYNVLKDNKSIQALFFHMDFVDVHDKGYILRALQALNLDSESHVQGDLSNENTDVLKEVSARLIAYMITRGLIVCEQGYSVDGIIDNLFEQFSKPIDNSCPQQYNARTCLETWAASFEDPAVLDYVKNILDCKTADSEAEIKQLLALMLLDSGVFKLNNEEDQQNFSKVNRRVRAQYTGPLSHDDGVANFPWCEFVPPVMFSDPKKDETMVPEDPSQAPDDGSRLQRTLSESSTVTATP